MVNIIIKHLPENDYMNMVQLSDLTYHRVLSATQGRVRLQVYNRTDSIKRIVQTFNYRQLCNDG
jgi:hypothetical protein